MIHHIVIMSYTNRNALRFYDIAVHRSCCGYPTHKTFYHFPQVIDVENERFLLRHTKKDCFVFFPRQLDCSYANVIDVSLGQLQGCSFVSGLRERRAASFRTIQDTLEETFTTHRDAALFI